MSRWHSPFWLLSVHSQSVDHSLDPEHILLLLLPLCRPRGPAAGDGPDAAHGPCGVPRHQRDAGECRLPAVLGGAGNAAGASPAACWQGGHPVLGVRCWMDDGLSYPSESDCCPSCLLLPARWCRRQGRRRLQTRLLRKAWRRERSPRRPRQPPHRALTFDIAGVCMCTNSDLLCTPVHWCVPLTPDTCGVTTL